MGNPTLYAIENEMVIESATITNNPAIRIKFHQQSSSMMNYRLLCKPNPPYTPTGFPTFYIYIGNTQTSPNYIYALDFRPVRVANTSDTTINIVNDIFAQYGDTDVLKPLVQLQSSTGDFSTCDTSAEEKEMTIRLKKDAFAPTWTAPTWWDESYNNNPGVAALTGTNQKAVQGVSTMRFVIDPATAKAGSTIDYYTIAFPGYPAITLSNSDVPSGGRAYTVLMRNYPKLVGSVKVVFSVTDIRGQTKSYEKTLTIVPYKEFTITKNNTHRVNGTGSTVVLDFSGQWNGAAGSPAIALSCTSIVAKVQGSSTTFATLTPTLTVSGTNFSYQAEWSGVTFDSETAYNVTITLTDTVKSVSFNFSIPVGTPVIAVRDGKVGINEADPTCALDVTGDIQVNGYDVFYNRGTIPSVDLNNCTTVGSYIQMAAKVNEYSNLPPVTLGSTAICPVIVEVTGAGSYFIQKLYSLNSDELFIRKKSGSSFGSWKKVTLT